MASSICLPASLCLARTSLDGYGPRDVLLCCCCCLLLSVAAQLRFAVLCCLELVQEPLVNVLYHYAPLWGTDSGCVGYSQYLWGYYLNPVSWYAIDILIYDLSGDMCCVPASMYCSAHSTVSHRHLALGSASAQRYCNGLGRSAVPVFASDAMHSNACSGLRASLHNCLSLLNSICR